MAAVDVKGLIQQHGLQNTTKINVEPSTKRSTTLHNNNNKGTLEYR